MYRNEHVSSTGRPSAIARTVHVARQLGEPLTITPADVEALHHRYQHEYGQPAATSEETPS